MNSQILFSQTVKTVRASIDSALQASELFSRLDGIRQNILADLLTDLRACREALPYLMTQEEPVANKAGPATDRPVLLEPKVVKCRVCGKATPNVLGMEGQCKSCHEAYQLVAKQAAEKAAIAAQEASRPQPATTPAQPVATPPVAAQSVKSQGEGLVRVDGFLVSNTIPDDNRLNKMGMPVLAAYCKHHGVDADHVGGSKADMVAALQLERDRHFIADADMQELIHGLNDTPPEERKSLIVNSEPPTARAGQTVSAKPKADRKAITFVGWGKEAIEQAMTRVWTIPLMVAWCNTSNFIIPPTLVDFIRQLNEEARRQGWQSEEQPTVAPVQAKSVAPQPAPKPPTPPAPVVRPAPKPVVPPISDGVKAQVVAALAKPTLGGLGKACDVAGLKDVDRKDTGSMRAALKSWLEGGKQPDAAPKSTPAKKVERIVDNPTEPRPTQVRILKALGKHGELTKKQIALFAPCNESDVTYWTGSMDQKVMDKNEQYRGMKCLIRLGLVEARVDQVVLEETGETVDTMIHFITDAGAQWLADNPNAKDK